MATVTTAAPAPWTGPSSGSYVVVDADGACTTEYDAAGSDWEILTGETFNDVLALCASEHALALDQVPACLTNSTGLSMECGSCMPSVVSCVFGCQACPTDRDSYDCQQCLASTCSSFSECSGVAFLVTATTGTPELTMNPNSTHAQTSPLPTYTLPDSSLGLVDENGVCAANAGAPGSDWNIISSDGFDDVRTACTYEYIFTNPEGIGPCIAEDAGITDDCANCMSGLASCVVGACLSHCSSDFNALNCQVCIYENCNDAFITCSGITLYKEAPVAETEAPDDDDDHDDHDHGCDDGHDHGEVDGEVCPAPHLQPSATAAVSVAALLALRFVF